MSKEQFVQDIVNPLLEGLRISNADISEFIKKVVKGLVNLSPKEDVIEYLAREAQYNFDIQYDFYILAGKILARFQLEQIPSKFSEHVTLLYNNYLDISDTVKKHIPLIDKKYYDIVTKNPEFFDNLIDFTREYDHGYMEYLRNKEKFFKKVSQREVDCVQYVHMRSALQFYSDDFTLLEECYKKMALNKISMATPTRASACMPKNQLSSCFLTRVKEDSIEGIYESLKQVALISKNGGGIGIDITDIRPKGDYIAGTDGQSTGITKMLRVYNETMMYVDQGGNKRKGALKVTLAIWHLDIIDFLYIRHDSRVAELRSADLHHCITIPDLFMNRVLEDGDWTVFSPKDAEILLGKKLNGMYGHKFEEAYISCEYKLKNKKIFKARELLFEIIKMQCITGEPFIFFIDHANNKTNQKNLGTATTTNLCTEIVEHTNGISVCNLRAVVLTTHISKENKFDFLELQDSVRLLVNSCDKSIDLTYYTLDECEKINKNDRPIAIGVIGLATLYKKLGYSWEDSEAYELNKQIFAHIYYAALEESCELAKKYGPYEGYDGSPISKGILQYDLWNAIPCKELDWEGLKAKIVKYGVRNSLLIGLMPTASTSQCISTGTSEGPFPEESNFVIRETTKGAFLYIDRELAEMLVTHGLWSNEIISEIQQNNGSVQNIKQLSEQMKKVYKTAFEYSYKVIIDHASDRGIYIDQSQSLNNYIVSSNPETMIQQLFDSHIRAWKKGLKTIYYTRSISHARPLDIKSNNQRCTNEISCESCAI